MKNKNLFALTALPFFFASSALMMTGCEADPVEPTGPQIQIKPALPIGPNVTFSSGNNASMNFGKVVLPKKATQTLLITNGGDTAAKILLGAPGLGLQAPYSAVTGAADECKDQQILEPTEGSCTITIEFAPKSDGVFTAAIKIPFVEATAVEPFDLTKAKSATLSISGTAEIGSPLLRIQADTANSVAGSLFSFGAVNVLKESTQLLRVSNAGNVGAKLDLGSTLEKLKTNAPFYVLDGGTCADKQILQPGADTCTIAVQYAPIIEGPATTTLEISYFNLGAAEVNLDKAATTLFTLNGSATLDCAVAPALAAKRADGVQKANDQMVIDAAQGKADGEALTPAQGTHDGDVSGYNDGYYAGYHGPEGYDKGYPVGKAEGLSRGRSDYASCSRGTGDGETDGTAAGQTKGRADGYKDGYADGLAIGKLAGASDGQHDGLAVGRTDGYTDGKNVGATDGYNDGYAAGDDRGYNDGYDDGFDDGATACGNQAKGNRAPVVTRPEADMTQLGTACYNQGYTATYSRSAYNNAYAAAKAANVPYQNAYRAAYPIGSARGSAAGKAQGYADGRAKGDADGFKEGSDQYYKSCYDAAYPIAYNSAYTQGYQNQYAVGKGDGNTDGYKTSYDTAYEQGYAQGHAQTYESGYGDTYQTAYNTGKTDGYENGYNDGYDDGLDDANSACDDGNQSKTLGAKRKAAGRTVRERALRNKPSAKAPLRFKLMAGVKADPTPTAARTALRTQAFKTALTARLKKLNH